MIGRTLVDAVSRRIDPFVGTTIWDRGDDWDICCILDGCRVDTFQQYYPRSESYWSVGSTSQDWIPRTFEDRDVSDVAYITGNPYSTRLDTDRFAVFHAQPVTDCEGVETVDPEALANRAIDVWRRREELGVERVVVHFMQPHVPFRTHPEWFEEFDSTDEWGARIWQVVGEKIGYTDWMSAYWSNLEWVLDHGITPLTTNADARLAITADHGNAAGEWGYAGHPAGCLHPSVRKVPWSTLEGTDERTITPDPREADADYDPATQREALGYA